MLPFRTEIRNTPTEQTIKIYLSNASIDIQIKEWLEEFDTIKLVELQKSLARNRMAENITVFKKTSVNINELKKSIDTALLNYFNEFSH